jgi:hypothetical protein
LSIFVSVFVDEASKTLLIFSSVNFGLIEKGQVTFNLGPVRSVQKCNKKEYLLYSYIKVFGSKRSLYECVCSVFLPITPAARGLEELFNNTVIDVTLLLHLWGCCINHNISATRTQPYRTDGQTDTLREGHLVVLKYVVIS